MIREVFKSLLLATLAVIALSVNLFAQGKFLYTNNEQSFNNSVSGFAIAADGTLTQLANSPWKTGGGGGTCFGCKSNHKILTTNRGPFLFVSNDGDRDISVFTINPQTGDLSSVPGSPFGIGGGDNDDRAISIAISPDEQFLFAGNPSNVGETGFSSIAAFKINNDGSLTAHADSPFTVQGFPSDLRVSRDGKYLLMGSGEVPGTPGGSISAFPINPDGSLQPIFFPTLVPYANSKGIIALELSRCGQYVYAALNFDDDTPKGGILVYHLKPQGTIQEIAEFAIIDEADLFSWDLQMTPDSKYLYRSIGNGGAIYSYRVNGDGSLTQLAAVGNGAFRDTGGMAIDREGQYLFVGDDRFQDPDDVSTYKIAANGTVAEIDGSPFPISTDEALHSIAVYPPLPTYSCYIGCTEPWIVANDKGECGAVVNYLIPETSGNGCGTVNCSPPPGTLFPVGATTVTCTAQGAADAEFTVTVKDFEAPTIECPKAAIKQTDPDQCSAVVNFTVNAADGCGGVEVVANPPSGSVFPKGDTQVTVTATDEAGNQSQCSFTVTVEDKQEPTINCPSDIVTNNQPGECGATVNYALPLVSDNCPGFGVPGCNPPSGSFFAVGATTVTCQVGDASQNLGVCTFKVTVNDVEAPKITCPADLTAVADKPCDAGLIVNYPAPQVMDNCPNINVVCVPASGAVFPVGATTVTCTVTDGGGNQAQCSFKITVFDIRLQDDASPGTVLLLNSFTGEYRLCAPNLAQTVKGIGTVMKKGCVTTLQHNTADRRLAAQVDPNLKKGTASYQSPPGSLKCTITDKDISNNTSLCQ